MKLIRDGRVDQHNWQFTDSIDQPVGSCDQIVTLEVFLQAKEKSVTAEKPPTNSPVGILLLLDDDLEKLAPHITKINLIVIEFSSFTDGRGFSIAYQLRNSLEYKGEIWLKGNLVVDQYALAIQCGVDAVLVDDAHLQRQQINQWQEVLENSPAPYRFYNIATPNLSDAGQGAILGRFDSASKQYSLTDQNAA